jgi:hypothetical protein
MRAELGEVSQRLRPETIEVMTMMEKLGYGALPWFFLPLYPLLAYYRDFNAEALQFRETTRTCVAVPLGRCRCSCCRHSPLVSPLREMLPLARAPLASLPPHPAPS